MGLEEKLPKTFSASNRPKTKILKRRIQDDVQMVEPYFLASMTDYNFLLPPILGMPPQFGKLLTDAVVDIYMRKELEECKAINWCRNIRTLSPIRNKGDGNCLLHAVSLFMWGVHDSMLLLRRLLYIALVHDTGQIKARWRKERGFLDQNIPEGCQLNSGQWESEWQHVVKSAEDQKQGDNHPNRLPYESLEEVHIFMLSNILRRPIIVLGDSVIRSIRGKTIAANNFVGIYLPLLRKPSDCVKSPIVIGFASNHFVPLVAMEEDLASGNVPMTTVEAVALVTHTLTFIGVHFLMQGEEERVNELLQEYLHITEVPVTQRSGLTLVLSAKLNITKLPKEYNLMIDFVQAAERVFDGKQPIVPTQYDTNTDIDLTEELLRSGSNGRPESQMLDSYHASRERQQRMLDRRASVNSKTSSNSTEKVNFNTDDKSKGHHNQDKVPLSTRSVAQGTKSHAEKMRSTQMVKCKTPKCRYYGSEETQGFCSSCLMEYLKKNIAARNAASRMDSYEMSVTSTDCQYPDCPYVASVYTYPFCHEHKTLSPYYETPAEPRTTEGGKQQVNDLNKDRSNTAKSSSLTEQSSSSSSRGKGTMQREHSRSLEDVHLPGDVDPGYVHEPRLDWCKMPGCYLMGHPENQSLCTQHYTEMKLRQQRASSTAKDGSNYHQQQKPSPVQKVEEWLRNGDFLSVQAANAGDSSEMITKPIYSSLTSQGRKCKKQECIRQGNPHFQGCCADCFLKLDINGDTEPLERPHYKEENKETQKICKKEEKNINPNFAGSIDNERSEEKKDKIGNDIIDHQLDSFQGPESSVGEKQEGSRADTQEFSKCKQHTCNRLAPPSGTEGYCSDCHYRAQESSVKEPPSVPKYSEPGLKADSTSHTAASTVVNPPIHYVRNVSLQSYPSLPVKQSYPSKNYTPTGAPSIDLPTQHEVSSHLRCTTSGCSGIYVKLDKNNTGLCYKCLKERMEAGNSSSSESEIQINTSLQGESPTSDEAQHLLRRLSGGRRSGRKRHTIAIPPTLPIGANNLEPTGEKKSCMSPLCSNAGSPMYSGFCKDCYAWMHLKFEQIDIQGLEEDRKTPCATERCEFFGTRATKGYCSQCFRKLQTYQGKEVTFGIGRQNSSGRSITPPPGAQGQLCANQHCDQYGQKAYYNFCPSCFKTFDSGSGISYNPPPTRGSFVPPGHSDSYYWSTTAAAQSNVPPPLPPRAEHFVPPIDIGPSDPAYYTSNTSGPATRPTDVAVRFGETMERVEIASRVGNQKCATPKCTSFGNSKCLGYCNSCYVKKIRSSFVLE